MPVWAMYSGITALLLYDTASILARIRSNYYAIATAFCLVTYAILGNFVLVDQYYRGLNQWFLKIAVVSASDALQYLIGKRYGRYHINPISPGKTLEGYLGSLLTIPIFLPVVPLPLLVTWISYGIIGDAFVSGLKRYLHIKDTSNLLGPQGGLIDRLDGIYMAFLMSS